MSSELELELWYYPVFTWFLYLHVTHGTQAFYWKNVSKFK